MRPAILRTENYKKGITTQHELEVIIATLEMAAQLKSANLFVEIGTHLALTSLAIIQILNDLNRSCHFVGFDISKSQSLHGNPFTAREKWIEICEPMAHTGPCIASFVEDGRDDIVDKFGDTVAWVFIDGCHCYECAYGDIERWAPKVVENGFLLMHDCHPVYNDYQELQFYHGDKAVPFGVNRAVKDSQILNRDFRMIHQSQPKKLRKARYLGGTQVFRRVRSDANIFDETMVSE